MINLFNFETYNIDTSQFTHILHDKVVTEFETMFANYVGAKYACGISSATNAIYLIFQDKCLVVKVPSMIPPVVVNAIVTNHKNLVEFYDDVTWIGNPYILHTFDDYKVIDSAQYVQKNQFKNTANDEDLMVFSFYPTKPISSCDGGMIVSNDKSKIDWFRAAVHNGTTPGTNSWDRKILFPGYKMYLSSIQAYIAMNNLLLYDNKIKEIDHIRNYYNMQLGYSNTSSHLYTIRVRNNKDFLSYMKSKDIQCGIHYEPLHLNEVYNKYAINRKSLPLTEEAANKIVSIPFHWKLTLSEVSDVCHIIKAY